MSRWRSRPCKPTGSRFRAPPPPAPSSAGPACANVGLDRLTRAALGTTPFGYAYDASGNRTQAVINGNAYDARGRLASATRSGGAVNYLVNALQQRVSKSGPGAIVATGRAYYVYDAHSRLIGEYEANAGLAQETIGLGNTPVGVVKADASLGYIYSDPLDTPRLIARPTGDPRHRLALGLHRALRQLARQLEPELARNLCLQPALARATRRRGVGVALQRQPGLQPPAGELCAVRSQRARRRDQYVRVCLGKSGLAC